jgi:hypothetical protein
MSSDSNAAFEDSFIDNNSLEDSSSGSNHLFGFDKSSTDSDSAGKSLDLFKYICVWS